MKTMLILAVCTCGVASVLYAAATSGASVAPRRAAAALGQLGAPNVDLGDLSHRFSAIGTTSGECDFNE